MISQDFSSNVSVAVLNLWRNTRRWMNLKRALCKQEKPFWTDLFCSKNFESSLGALLKQENIINRSLLFWDNELASCHYMTLFNFSLFDAVTQSENIGSKQNWVRIWNLVKIILKIISTENHVELWRFSRSISELHTQNRCRSYNGSTADDWSIKFEEAKGILAIY